MKKDVISEWVSRVFFSPLAAWDVGRSAEARVDRPGRAHGNRTTPTTRAVVTVPTTPPWYDYG